jgi:putative flippase GtrA
MTPPTNSSLVEPVEAVETPTAISPHMRLIHGLRKPANWMQLVQFGVVGGTGFAINTVVYILVLNREGRSHYILASFVAFCFAVTNNFLWNRLWTFRHRKDASHAAFQAVRFFVVSGVAYAINATLLTLFVEVAGMNEIVSQVCAVMLVMPISFLGNKLWSFR